MKNYISKGDLFKKLGLGSLGVGTIGSITVIFNDGLTEQINHPILVLSPIIFSAVCLGIGFIRQIKTNAEHDLEFNIKAFILDRVHEHESKSEIDVSEIKEEKEKLINYINTTNIKRKEETVKFIENSYQSIGSN